MFDLLTFDNAELSEKIKEADQVLEKIPVGGDALVRGCVSDMTEVVKNIPTRPVSISQLKSWLSCKRKWALQRTFPETDLKEFFVLGKAVHRALEVYHKSGKDAELSHLAMQRELVPDVEHSFLNLYPLTKSMFDGYIDFDKKFHSFDIIDTEIEFEIPLEDVSADALMSLSEEERKTIPKAKGVIDFVAVTTKEIYVSDTVVIPAGEIIAGEYKTAAKSGNIDYETDPQASLYLLALSKILGRPVNWIVYNTLYKKKPAKPEILKSGDVSARAITTTQKIYGDALIEVYGSVEAAPEKCQALYNNLVNSDTSFYDRTFVHRCSEELQEVQERLGRMIPMLNEDYESISNGFEETQQYDFSRCYPNPGRDCPTMCERREQCLSMNRNQPLLANKGFSVKIGQK